MAEAQAALWWLPVGAGGRVVVHTSRWWEAVQARREHRAARPLFHAALEVSVAQERWVIEMAPAWGQRAVSRGVVAQGPVGFELLGRLRLFRYEVRCWAGGDIPDRDFAPVPPTLIPLSPGAARSMLRQVGEVPRYTWGRDVMGVGDMWNSNSLVSWLLVNARIDASTLAPPLDGAAPGWAAGIAATAFGADGSNA
jgi:hypothetical protein